MERRDAFDELGETLGALVEQDQAAGQTEPARKRPKYPSETQRLKLSIDVDLEPCVGKVLAALAATPAPPMGVRAGIGFVFTEGFCMTDSP